MPIRAFAGETLPEGGRVGVPLLPGDGEGTTVVEFVAALRSLKISAGNPSFQDLERDSGVPRSTLADALSRRRRAAPRWDVVAAFVKACGGSAELRRWHELWAAVKQNTDTPDPSGVGAGWYAAAPGSGPGPGPERIVPRELPSAIGHFTGRREQLAALRALAARTESPARPAGAAVVAVVTGPAGIGKSALAVHWAQQHADMFPDGQLYLDLTGSADTAASRSSDSTAASRSLDFTAASRSPDSIVRPLLESLLGPGYPVPAAPAAQSALYRSRLAGTRTLLVVDGADDVGQIRPLLAASVGCFTIVTSRRPLTDLVALDGAEPLTLGPLTESEALELLAHRLGAARVHQDVPAASRLVAHCGRRPLSLNLAIARGFAQPETSLDELFQEAG